MRPRTLLWPRPSTLDTRNHAREKNAETITEGRGGGAVAYRIRRVVRIVESLLYFLDFGGRNLPCPAFCGQFFYVFSVLRFCLIDV